MAAAYSTPMVTNTQTQPPNVISSPIASQKPPMLSVRKVEKVYGSRGNKTQALAGVSFDVNKGEFMGIMGASGSGKTTLLNCISTIDRPSAGQILVDGDNIATLNKRQLAKFRRDDLGFIFQDSNLLNTLTGFENVALALSIKHVPASAIPLLVDSIASRLGVKEVLKKYPYEMSGGQQQRIAAARAMVSEPKFILADEPTGALDSKSSMQLLEMLELLNRDLAATIIMVTHDAFAASFTDRVVFLRNGKIFNEIRRGSDTREQFFSRILDVVAFLGGEANNVA